MLRQSLPFHRQVALLSCMYFLGGLTGATWGRFATIYFNEVKHLSPAEIGIIEGVMPGVQAVFQPCWGWCADRYNAKKEVYLFTSVVNTSLLLLLAIPQVATGFVPIILINGSLSAFIAGGVLDAFTLDFLGPEHRQKYYGRIRLWTAVSWGTGSFAMGIMTDYTHDFLFNFCLYGGMSCLSLLVTWMVIPSKRTAQATATDPTGVSRRCEKQNPLPLAEKVSVPEPMEETKGSSTEEEESEHMADMAAVWIVLRRPATVLFLLQVSFMGAAVGVVERLLFVYLQNELGGSTTLCGATVLVTVVFEIPIFYFNRRIARALGHDGMFLVAMAAYIVRAIGYTLLTHTTRFYILPLEALHGLTFALIWCAAVEHAKKIAPPGWSATFQTLVTTAWRCFGVGIGAVVGGHVMGRWGGRWLYRGSAMCVAMLAATQVVTMTCGRLWKKTPDRDVPVTQDAAALR